MQPWKTLMMMMTKIMMMTEMNLMITMMSRYAAKSNLEKLREDLEDENLRLRFFKEKAKLLKDSCHDKMTLIMMMRLTVRIFCAMMASSSSS